MLAHSPRTGRASSGQGVRNAFLSSKAPPAYRFHLRSTSLRPRASAEQRDASYERAGKELEQALLRHSRRQMTLAGIAAGLLAAGPISGASAAEGSAIDTSITSQVRPPQQPSVAVTTSGR